MARYTLSKSAVRVVLDWTGAETCTIVQIGVGRTAEAEGEGRAGQTVAGARLAHLTHTHHSRGALSKAAVVGLQVGVVSYTCEAQTSIHAGQAWGNTTEAGCSVAIELLWTCRLANCTK